MGVTSLWLVIPIYHSIIVEGFASNRVLTATTLMVSIISTIMWRNKITNSVLWKLDIAPARAEFICLIWHNQYKPSMFQILYPVCVAIMYTIVDINCTNKRWGAAILSHILFRCIGYMWCHHTLIGNIDCIFELMAIYFMHIVFKLNETRSRSYLFNVIEMLILIAITRAAFVSE
jgi:hypothetical protein